MNQIEAMRIYAAIDMDACRNIDAMLAKLRPETKMTLVIKTDAYGHGALPVARLGETLDRVWGYAVATSQEGFSLRRNGIKKPILILGYTFEGDYPEMVAQEIRPVVFRYETAEIFSRAAKEARKTVHIHIGLDTGMHRIGFRIRRRASKKSRRFSSWKTWSWRESLPILPEPTRRIRPMRGPMHNFVKLW